MVKSLVSGPDPGRLAADKRAALALCPVSRETEARLDAYVALLLAWQAKTNLISPATLDAIWIRHIADSLQLLDIAPAGRVWVDLGSGGGFPGIVLACALADRPDAIVHLVERNNRKAAFLREALRVTGGRGVVHVMNIEDYVDSNPPKADYVTARALAPLKVLITMAEPLIRNGATGLFLKGQDIESELTEATKYWNFSSLLHPSRTQAGSAIVEVRQLHALDAKDGRRS